MHINLRFFASVREALGASHETIDLPAGLTTVADVRNLLISRGGVWADTLGEGRTLRMAFNQQMCDPGTVLADGGEVAFFPPVTGG
ncbi:MAG: molybdopterin converting factor subunit 1 [Pseudomonadota bacterium]|nr:molybdopterin converting factor subunit 1 [Pseudomonadota bacterium]